MSSETKPGGLHLAIAAYLCWGFLPLYIALLRHVPAFELVGWRVIFTLPLCLVIILARRQWPDLKAALGNSRVMRLLAISALMIGANWVIYVAAINAGQIYAASLGYYINPLLNVLLGTVFLGEKLSRLQWGAVALATAGVTILLFGAIDTLGISLVCDWPGGVQLWPRHEQQPAADRRRRGDRGAAADVRGGGTAD